VTVTDRSGAHVTGLQPDAFSLRQRDRSLQITHFSSKAEPFSIGLIIDTSASMETWGVQRVQEAVEKVVQGGHDDSQYFVVGVPGRGTRTLDWTRDRTTVLERVSTLSKPGNVSGSTDLHNAVLWSVDKLLRGTYARRALIVASDGLDTSSTVPFGQVVTALRATSTTMFVLAPTGRGRTVTARENPFLELPQQNAGRTIHLRRYDHGASAGELIAKDLRHQYFIGFLPATPVGDGKWHPITISATVTGRGAEDIQVLSKKAYFAFK
jgi:Ca-activated chloride channel family protein